jgi:DNA (cytosine-5)-methyltransferase 1
MENVAEMRNGFNQAYSAEIVSRLEAAGYGVVHMVLNAADYGVPQRRRRAFFLGCRNGSIVASPMPTHTKGSAQNDLLARNGHVTVWEAIGDLPSLHHGDGDGLVGYRCDPFSEYQHAVRGRQMEVANHVARHLRPTQLARLEALAPGQAHKDLPKHLQVRGGYSGVYGRLTKDMIAPTITRWVFHPGSGRWGHPVDTRLITMREAARIQGFPDSFEFVGSYVQQAGQIGNAVPPILVQKVIDAILSQTGNSNLSRKAIA